jgi:hypothetical protein
VSFWHRKERTLVSKGSGGINHSLVNQQNGNIVPDGVHATASRAFQAGAIFFQGERLLARRANQNVEQVLSHHEHILRLLLLFVSVARHPCL